MAYKRLILRLLTLAGLVLGVLILTMAMLTFVQADGPAIVIVKEADQTVVSGSTAIFTIAVTNTGDVTLTNVTVSDGLAPNCARVIGDLYPGASASYECTRTNVTADFTNSATVTGTDTVSDTEVTNTDTASVDAIHPDIEIAKTPDSQMVRHNLTVTFTVAVTNTGDVTLTNVTVADLQASDCARTLGSLAADASTSYVCTRDNVTVDFDNVATVTGTPPVGADVSDFDTASVDVISPDVEIAKTPDSQMVRYNSMAIFTIAVTNTGDVTLTNVTVTDLQASDCARTLGSLAADASTSYVCTRDNVTVDFDNVATVTGTPPVGADVSDFDTASVDVISPDIEISKTPDSQTVRSNSTVTFTISVVNTGDVTLSDVTVSDVRAPNCARTVGTLTVGDDYAYACTAPSVTDDFVNIATATGTPPVGTVVGDTDTAFVDVIHPDIEIVKTPNEQTIVSSSTVTFTIAITNTGDVSLSDVVISDAQAPNCAQTVGTLAAGGDLTYACTVANVTSDFMNVAMVTGTPPVGADVSDSDTAFVDVINPYIEIAKTPDSQMVRHNSTATFTIAVTNTSDVSLTDVTVSDAQAPDCARTVGTLAVGDNHTYACTVANVMDDFINIATAMGTPPVGPDVDDTDIAFVDVINPDIKIAKTPDSQTVRSNSPATFTIAVTNTGDVPLTKVTVSDALVLNCARVIGDLDPGESTGYECTRINVTADFTNSATVVGTPPVGDVVTDTDTARVEIDRTEACPARMVAYWRLDETGGPTYDDFYDGHDGECAGNCPDPATGHVNGGQAFNGSNTGIDVLADEDFNWGVHDSFSIEFWLRTDSASTCFGNQVVIGRDDSATGLHWWVGCRDGGQSAFYLRDTGGTLAGVMGTTDLTDGSWHHIVAVREAGGASANKVRIHIDGVEEGSTPVTYTFGFESLTAALNIGWLNMSSYGFHFDGIVDEIALYDRALPTSEVLQHYNEGLDGRWYCEAGTFAPKIVSAPVIGAAVGRLYIYDVEATGNPAPTYTLGTKPGGMAIDPATGLISWTPTSAQGGKHDVEVEASNSEGTDTQSFTVVVAEGMIAHWRLDETSGVTYYDSFDGHDGECAGSCPDPAIGHVNGGQAFDGSTAGIDVPADEDFDWDPTDSFSIEFWLRTDSASTCSGNQVVVGRDDSSTSLHWWVGCQDGGQAAFHLIDTGGRYASAIGTTDLTDGAWHHVVAIRDADADEIRIYVDTIEEDATTVFYTDGFDSPMAALNIGWLDLFPGFHFDGIVDEVALYGLVLYEAQSPSEERLYLPMIFTSFSILDETKFPVRFSEKSRMKR